MKVGFPLENTLVLNSIAILAKQLKKETSHTYHKQNNNPIIPYNVSIPFLICVIHHNFYYMQMTKYWFQISKNKIPEYCEFQKSHCLHYPYGKFFTILPFLYSMVNLPLLKDPSWACSTHLYPISPPITSLLYFSLDPSPHFPSRVTKQPFLPMFTRFLKH